MKTAFVVISVFDDGTDDGSIRLEKIFTSKDRAYFYVEDKNESLNEEGYYFHMREVEFEG